MVAISFPRREYWRWAWVSHWRRAETRAARRLSPFRRNAVPGAGFLNVYPFRYAWVADHFQYLASLGMIVPLASVLTTAVERLVSDRQVRIASAAALVLVLGVLTWRQSGGSRDVETLYRQTLARNPESWLAHNNLGGRLLEKGELRSAMAEFDTAMRINPIIPRRTSTGDSRSRAHPQPGGCRRGIPGRAPVKTRLRGGAL